MTYVITLGSGYFLLALIMTGIVLLVASIAFHAKCSVPFVPTPNSVVRAMLKAADLKPGDTVYDLGAGDGRFLIAAKKQYPDIRAIGYEGAIGVWLLAKLKIILSRQDVDMRLANFFKDDLSSADVIFTYLSVATMAALLPKFMKELKPGTRVISHAFRLPGIVTEVTEVPMLMYGTTKIHRYVWPPKAAPTA